MGTAARDAPDDPRRVDPDAVAAAVLITVMTAGRAVFFSGLTVLLGLTGLILFEFPILRSVGIAGAIVVGLAVTAALTLLPAILSVLGERVDAGRIRQVNAAETADGPWARLARRVMRHPVAVFIPTLGFLLLLGAPFLHVRFNAPDATILPPDVPSRAAFDRLDAKFGAGRFAPLALAIRTAGPATTPANVAALYDYSRRLGGGPTDRQGRRLRGRRPAVDPRPIPAAVRSAGPSTGPLRRDRPGRHDEGRPDDVHADDAVRAERRRGTPARGRSPGTRWTPRGAAGHGAARRRRRGRRGRRGRRDRCRLRPDGAVHLRLDLPRPVRAPSIGRPAGESARDEHAVDRRRVRRPRLDLPGRQPVGAARVPAPRLCRDHPAGDPLLRPVRALDGLRGLPAVADEGGLGPDRRQHGGGRPRSRTERPDRDLGRPDRRRRGRFVRVRRHRPDQGHRPRRGDLGRARRDRRPGVAGPGDDAPARRPQLVDARAARTLVRGPPARRRKRDRGGRPDEPCRGQRRSRDRPAPGRFGRGLRGRRLQRADPGQPRSGSRARPRDCDATTFAERPTTDRPAGRRCASRPAHGVVVLHRSPAGQLGRALWVRVRHLPSRTGHVPGDLGVAPGDHRRGRRGVPLRPAERDRTAGRRRAHAVERADDVRVGDHGARARSAGRRADTVGHAWERRTRPSGRGARSG